MILSPNWSAIDRRLIDATLRMGRSALGRTWPNPAVGALIVQFDDAGWPIVVGRGITGEGGRPHAEEIALDRAGDAAKGATAYVSLEPCAHRNRPNVAPCSHRLASAGVARVVAAIDDPNPSIDGRGYDHLRAHDISVVDRLSSMEGKRAHLGHFLRMARGRPMVTLKLAISQDNMIGREGEGQVAITGPQARARAHMMRAQSDAIMVGIGTVLSDDPTLDCRLPGLAGQSPVRLVLDTYARLPLDSVIARTAFRLPTWVLTAPIVDQERVSLLAGARIERLAAPVIVGPREDRINLAKALVLLGDRGITRVMLEGGAKLAADFLKQGLVDEIALFRASHTVGDRGVPVLDGADLEGYLNRDFHKISSETVGDDELITYVRSS